MNVQPSFKGSVRSVLVTFLGAALLCTSAHAALLVDQPGSNLPGFTSANNNGNGGGRAVFDDFVVGSDFQLTRVEWTGGAVSTSNLVDASAAPAVQFALSIVSDDGNGRPDGGPLLTLTPGFQTIVGSVLSASSSEAVYRYGLDVPTMPTLNANTRYWLEITAMFVAPADGLLWDWSAGAGGNGVGFYYYTIANDYLNSLGDQSFSIFGDVRASVPEPSSLMLLALSLAAAGFASAQRKRTQ